MIDMDDLDGKNLYLGYEWEHVDWVWSLAKRYKIPLPEIKEESRKEEGGEE